MSFASTAFNKFLVFNSKDVNEKPHWKLRKGFEHGSNHRTTHTKTSKIINIQRLVNRQGKLNQPLERHYTSKNNDSITP